MLADHMQAQSLGRFMHEHSYYSRSLDMADRAIRQRFPQLNPWKLDLFQRQYLDQLDRLGENLSSIDGLTWTRGQRKERRHLTRELKLGQRGALRTALEIWCITASSRRASEIQALCELRKAI